MGLVGGLEIWRRGGEGDATRNSLPPSLPLPAFMHVTWTASVALAVASASTDTAGKSSETASKAVARMQLGVCTPARTTWPTASRRSREARWEPQKAEKRFLEMTCSPAAGWRPSTSSEPETLCRDVYDEEGRG